MQVCSELRQEVPTESQVLNVLALVWKAAGQLKELTAVYAAAHEAHPKDPEFLLSLFAAYVAYAPKPDEVCLFILISCFACSLVTVLASLRQLWAHTDCHLCCVGLVVLPAQPEVTAAYYCYLVTTHRALRDYISTRACRKWLSQACTHII